MKMKEKTKKRIQGSISVLLVIILLPMMTFSALIVDMSRVNMAKQMMSSAGDLTMNTALANYDTILKDAYGLFAMSQAEGMDNEQLGIELNKYFAKTLSSYGVVSEDEADDYVAALIGDFRDILNNGSVNTNNFLELNNINLTVTKVEGSSLANASILRKQIVEYMKYRAPLGLGLSFLDSLTAFEKMDAQNKVVEAQVKAQESTQDVTKACQTLIKMIRDYDKRVAEINGALSGVSNSGDTAIIPLEDYDSHVSKYLSSWGENYTHINKLTLVFLANTPSVDSVYLKALAYAGGERYIKTDGTLYNGSNGIGFSVNPSLAGNTADAKTQIEQQITNLNNNFKPYANKYTSSMLPSNLLTYNSNNINAATIIKDNEDSAINSFIKFEKFLLDQAESGNITYSQVKSVLEQIAILDKYRANYETKINADISAAEGEKQSAQNTLNTYKSNRDNAATAMSNAVTNINNYLTAFSDGQTGQLSSVLDALPAISGSYSSYNNNYIKAGTADNKYIEAFRQQINGPMATAGTEDQKAIIAEAKKYIEKSNYDPDGFEQHMKNKCTDAQEKDIVFKYLCCLMKCHSQATKYQSSLTTYNNVVNKIPGAETALNQATQKVNGLYGQKTSTINSVKGCIQGFYSFGGAYQADAYYYNYYINAAKNTVGPEAQKIQTHFSQLLAYLGELRTDLNDIDVQIGKVKTAITTYNNNLDTWENSNTSYESSNGGDSFSSQTSDDIEKARTEYDAALYDTLDTFVIAMWNEFDDLYTKLTDSTNFVYGSKRIDQIASADDLVAAISGTSFSNVVTVDEATQKLSTLYRGETVEYNPYTMDYSNPKQLGFLAPQVLQIQALKYLNSTYPEAIKLTCGGCGDCSNCTAKQNQDNTQADYNDAKGKLTGKTESSSDSGGSDEVDTDFGYTFNSNSVLGNLPSDLTSTEKKEFSDSEYTLSETGEGDDAKLNASSGVGGQTSKSSSVLSGLGGIATTAVENLYILNYVFENFSYNTIVQDQIIKNNKVNSNTVIGQITEAETHFSDAEIIAAAKKDITTLSNYAINEKNNHLYGGEIEYILFGNSTPSKNVTSAKASIYAIRFGFNCIFAFTDSEIRNSTMAAGLAVQAATLGVVPYQVVQIVLQLALAAAESAIDLSAMNHGLTVAIVKTRDTWSLSASGGAAVLKDAANAAANMVTNTVTGLATEAINSVTNGLNDLLDASADELRGAIVDLEKNMGSAAEGMLEGVVDDILTSLMAEIEDSINQLQYVGLGDTTTDPNGNVIDVIPDKATVKNKTTELFQGIRNKVSTLVSDACGGNEAALSIASRLEEEANRMISDMEADILATIEDAGDTSDITSYIAGKVNELKMTLVEYGNTFVANTLSDVSGAAQEVVTGIQDDLKGYIDQCGEELSEAEADEIKKQVSAFTDDFVNTTINVGGSTSSVTDPKSSVVSMFKFGYKDYLMLLTYISICCGDSVLVRTSDVIQMNIQSAGADADYQHKANTEDSSFMMSKAYTYISISATADLDMFFMNFGIFADQVASDNETGLEVNDDGTKITYKGLLGY